MMITQSVMHKHDAKDEATSLECDLYFIFYVIFIFDIELLIVQDSAYMNKLM